MQSLLISLPFVFLHDTKTYVNVTHDVRYAGTSHSEMVECCNGEVMYNQVRG